MRRATPQRTAESRWVAPTPTIAPVMVCVVLTGIPARAVENKCDRSRRFGAESSHRLQLGDARAHGVHNSPATEISSQRNRSVRGQNDGPMKFPPAARQFRRRSEVRPVERAGHDPHRLLRVVAAVTQAVGGGREQLQLAKPGVNSSVEACFAEARRWQP